MQNYEELLKNNKEWAANIIDTDPDFFNNLSKLQTPNFLWIGCSDSRVPANQITGTQPGEVFVHRNVANLVVNTDLNMLSCVKYAVEVLGVEHIIVCGHYGCGGVAASMGNHDYGLINFWLRNIKDVYRMHEKELDAIVDFTDRQNRLVELNVVEQVYNLAKSRIIQQAWQKHKRPTIHGWVYSLENGLLKDLCKMDYNSPIDPIYQFEFDSTDHGGSTHPSK